MSGRLRWISMAALAWLCTMMPATAAQSLKLTGSGTATATVPGATQYRALRTHGVEMRVRDIKPVSQPKQLYRCGGMVIFVMPGATVTLNIAEDSVSRSTMLPLAGRPEEVRIRIERNPDASSSLDKFKFWIWNGDGSNRVEQRVLIDVPQPEVNAASTTCYLGDAGLELELADLEWYTALKGDSDPAPNDYTTGNLGSWHFEGNLLDTSGSGMHWSMGAAQYVASLNYPPRVSIAPVMSARAGQPVTLDGTRSYALTGAGPALSWSWQQVEGPTEVKWSNRTTATPSVMGLIAGAYEFRLTVADVQQQQSTATIRVSAVATDDRGMVLGMPDYAEFLLGPLLRMGASPWPFADDRHDRMTQWFGARIMDPTVETDISLRPAYRADWDEALPGTIAVTQGSRVVTGTGTEFRAAFCGGGNNPESGNLRLIVWYPTGEGGTGRGAYVIARCDSDTQLTLAEDYRDTAGTTESVQYAKAATINAWINGSENINYYDNVMAFYAAYYRTGRPEYLDYARRLADLWFKMPQIDEGRCVNTNRCVVNRVMSFTGLVMRALDGRADMWPGLRRIVDAQVVPFTAWDHLVDVREDSYVLSWHALLAKFDPDAGKRALYTGRIATSKGIKWASPKSRGQNGNLVAIQYEFSTWNNGIGLATVTQGSNIVTGTGTNWDERCHGARFWVTPNPNDPALDDQAAYVATWSVANPGQLTLDRPYEGQSRANLEWSCGAMVGRGTQPFMLGIAATAFYWAWKATGDDQWRAWAMDKDGMLNWLVRYGYHAATKGLHYGRAFANCEPIDPLTTLNTPCRSPDDADPTGPRYLAAEVLGAVGRWHHETGEYWLKRFGDTLYGAIWGKVGFGGPSSDGHYITELDDGSDTFRYPKRKNFGFMCGPFGDCGGWPAKRLPKEGESVFVTLNVDHNLASIPNASTARVLLTRPDGRVIQTACAASPCPVTADRRQGTHWVEIEYVSGSGKVLSRSQKTMVTVK